MGFGVVIFGLFVFVLGFFLYRCQFKGCGKEIQEYDKEVQNYCFISSESTKQVQMHKYIPVSLKLINI